MVKTGIEVKSLFSPQSFLILNNSILVTAYAIASQEIQVWNKICAAFLS